MFGQSTKPISLSANPTISEALEIFVKTKSGEYETFSMLSTLSSAREKIILPLQEIVLTSDEIKIVNDTSGKAKDSLENLITYKRYSILVLEAIANKSAYSA
jgi:hypothetical protein